MGRKIIWMALAVVFGISPLVGAPGDPGTSRGTVINNYYPYSERNIRQTYPGAYYRNSVNPTVDANGNPLPPPSPYPNSMYQPYAAPNPPPYYDRPKYNDNREWVKQRYYNDKFNRMSPPLSNQQNRRPSLSDRIQQDKQMRQRDSQLQRDFIREESLRTY